MTTSIVQDQELEKQIKKQMGCMAGFLQIFDRQQILAGKRLYSTKRLTSSTGADLTSESEPETESPAISRVFEKPQQKKSQTPELRSPSPENFTTPVGTPIKLSPLPVFDFKEGARSPWKFSKEAPRLSLDSRAVVDARGGLKPREIRTSSGEDISNDDQEKQRRSPSVIARLMGLEPILNSDHEAVKPAELRRSASESRVNRDLLQSQYRFIDGVNLQMKQQSSNVATNVIRDRAVNVAKEENMRRTELDLKGYSSVHRSVRAEPAKSRIVQKKSFFDSADFFPEPKQTVSIYSEIEKRLKMRGIDEPSKDLEALKQILEALQLKGLLHSRKNCNPVPQINNRNFVYDYEEESPIVLMKPAISVLNRPDRIVNDSITSRQAKARRNQTETQPAAVSPRPQVRGRGSISPTRSDANVQSPNRRRAMNNIETQRRASPVQSPRVSQRPTGPEQGSNNRSPRIKKPTVEIYRNPEDELSSISESSISSSSQTDTDRCKVSLLERCDKLLHSIAEITTELQPSPVSVLDSSFYKEESSPSPSPVMKRSIEFKDHAVEFDDDQWSPQAISPIQLKSNNCDFVYIADILCASNYFPVDTDIFLLLEKQQYLKGNDSSKTSMLDRRLIFDTITEIVNRKKQLPPFKGVSWNNCDIGQASLQQIWSEFQKIREKDTSEDLFEVICSVLKKDLAGDALTGWSDCPVEISEAVLDIERLIFKDLIGETIQDLAAGKSNQVSPGILRRKLVF